MSAPRILPSSGIQPEIAVGAIPTDERIWVPQAPNVWFRPLLLNTVTGGDHFKGAANEVLHSLPLQRLKR
jgi:hypothetical protein